MPLLVFKLGPLDCDVDHIFRLCDPVGVDAVFGDHWLRSGYLLILLLLLHGGFIIAHVRCSSCFLLLGTAMSIAMVGSTRSSVVTLPYWFRSLLLRRFRLGAHSILGSD